MLWWQASPPAFPELCNHNSAAPKAFGAASTHEPGSLLLHLPRAFIEREIFVTQPAEGVEDRICFLAHWLTLARCAPAAAGPLHSGVLVASGYSPRLFGHLHGRCLGRSVSARVLGLHGHRVNAAFAGATALGAELDGKSTDVLDVAREISEPQPLSGSLLVERMRSLFLRGL